MAKEKGSFKEFLSAVAPEYQTSWVVCAEVTVRKSTS